MVGKGKREGARVSKPTGTDGTGKCGLRLRWGCGGAVVGRCAAALCRKLHWRCGECERTGGHRILGLREGLPACMVQHALRRKACLVEVVEGRRV